MSSCLKFCLELLGSFPRTDFSYGSTHTCQPGFWLGLPIKTNPAADELFSILTFSFSLQMLLVASKAHTVQWSILQKAHFFLYLPRNGS